MPDNMPRAEDMLTYRGDPYKVDQGFQMEEEQVKQTIAQCTAIELLDRLKEKIRTEGLFDLHVDGGQQNWCVTLTFPTKKG